MSPIAEYSNKKKNDYLAVKNYIMSTYHSGERVPGEKELATQIKTTHYAAFRAINELTQEGVLLRRQGKGTFVSEDRSSVSGHISSKVITGLMLPNFTTPLMFEITDGLARQLKSYGKDLLLWSSDGNYDTEAFYLEKAEKMKLGGLVWWPNPIGRAHEHLKTLVEQHFLIVMLDRSCPGINCPLVQPDHYGGVYQAIKYLINIGHRRIAFVTNDPLQRSMVSAVQERERAYLDAMKETGLPVDPDWLIELDTDLVRQSLSNPKIVDMLAYEPVHRLIEMKPRPTAIFLLHDELAPGAIRAAKNAGLQIPKDISLIGFNDVPIARFLEVSLSTVHYPSQKIGALAADLLEKMVNGETIEKMNWKVSCELVLRNSSAKVGE